MREVTAAEVKGLFHHLVKKVGGLEAAASYLSVSFQRVSQLQSINCTDMPTIMQVVTLELAVGQPVVTGVLAEASTGEGASCVHRAAVVAMEQGVKALRLVHDMDADKVRESVEITAVQRAAIENVDAAKGLLDAATALQPGRVG